jgi:hypothetical protein
MLLSLYRKSADVEEDINRPASENLQPPIKEEKRGTSYRADVNGGAADATAEQ